MLTWLGIAYTGSLASLEMLAWNMAGAGAFMGWHTVCGILTFGFLKVLVLECAVLFCHALCAGHPPVPRGRRPRDPRPGRGEAQRARLPHR